MAESFFGSEWSTEVSCFMDMQMCACVLEVRWEGAGQQVLESYCCSILLAQFSASLDFACLYRLVESSEYYTVRALFYK